MKPMTITLLRGEMRSNDFPNFEAVNCEMTWAGKYTIITRIGTITTETSVKRFSIKYAEMNGEYIVPVMEVARSARIKAANPMLKI